MKRVWLVGAVAVAALASGCSFSDDATPLPAPPEPAATTPPAAPVPNDCGNALQSYAPRGALPAPGAMPSGSTMREIQERGRLIVGVSADSYLLGSANPLDGNKIQGFDIDLVNAVAEAIFGTAAGNVEFRVITAADRIPVLQDESVDMVARNMSITCDRWTDIAFSTVYYQAGQKVLVPKGSPADTDLDALAGQRVCAPAGTTSMTKLEEVQPDAEPVSAGTHTGCLVLFQNGEVDAITGDDTVLAGLAAQDPYAYVPPDQEAVSAEYYGLGFTKSDRDLVEFVNAVLEDYRRDGRWEQSYQRWFADTLGGDPQPPAPQYGRTR
jgi:polar amino acid transport system substrate-binding protein